MATRRPNRSYSDSRYYIDGSTVRIREENMAAPARHQNPRRREEVKRQKQTRKRTEVQTYKRSAEIAANSLSFDGRYLMFLMTCVVLMVGACSYMLYFQNRVTAREKNINALQAEIQAVQDDNLQYEHQLENMYTVQDIYRIATRRLGMVYAKPGQIMHYDTTDEDYVNQYQDVPGSN